MAHWSLEDISWQNFDSSKAEPTLIAAMKAAAIVEYNSYDYARYLREVFPDDASFQQAAQTWAEEEVQHGQALKRWAELADPAFDFDKSFATFTSGFALPTNVQASVRGSCSGELLARCVVETGTSSYYTAIKDYTQEPVLQEICAKIAADELRHYKLFYTHLKRYLATDRLSKLERIKIAFGRIVESEDDELAYAFFAANHTDSETYNHKRCKDRYLACTYLLYKRRHIQQMTAMVFKAIGMKPNSWLNRFINMLAWSVMSLRQRRLTIS